MSQLGVQTSLAALFYTPIFIVVDLSVIVIVEYGVWPVTIAPSPKIFVRCTLYLTLQTDVKSWSKRPKLPRKLMKTPKLTCWKKWSWNVFFAYGPIFLGSWGSSARKRTSIEAQRAESGAGFLSLEVEQAPPHQLEGLVERCKFLSGV